MRYLFIMLPFNKTSNYDFDYCQLPKAGHQSLMTYFN